MADIATGLVSGARRLSPDALDARVRRVATGLAALGVAPGQCVAILMRNDIAFMEAAYAAQTLGAYAVPINWHFKAEEILLTSLDEEGYAAVKPLTDHPEYERWKDLMAPGEFWSTVGESWITEGDSKKPSATGR